MQQQLLGAALNRALYFIWGGNLIWHGEHVEACANEGSTINICNYQKYQKGWYRRASVILEHHIFTSHETLS